MRQYLKLIRVKHYVKNILVGIPLLLSSGSWNSYSFVKIVLGIAAFCLMASVIYIINDLRDLDKDKLHTENQKRPLASGAIKIPTAIVITVFLFLISTGIMFVLLFAYNISWHAACLIYLYLLINIAYNLGLKCVAIVEIFIIAAGFALRILFGAGLIKGIVSPWLIMVVIASAIAMVFGKRCGEIVTQRQNTRTVNQAYSLQFTKNCAYIFGGLTIIFYAMLCVEYSIVFGPIIIWSVFIAMFIVTRYLFLIEKQENLRKDMALICGTVLCAVFVIGVICYSVW